VFWPLKAGCVSSSFVIAQTWGQTCSTTVATRLPKVTYCSSPWETSINVYTGPNLNLKITQPLKYGIAKLDWQRVIVLRTTVSRHLLDDFIPKYSTKPRCEGAGRWRATGQNSGALSTYPEMDVPPPNLNIGFCQKWIGSREIWRYLPFKMGVFLQVNPIRFSGPMFNPKTFNSLLRPIPFWYSRHGSSSGATWRFRHVSTHRLRENDWHGPVPQRAMAMEIPVSMDLNGEFGWWLEGPPMSCCEAWVADLIQGTSSYLDVGKNTWMVVFLLGRVWMKPFRFGAKFFRTTSVYFACSSFPKTPSIASSSNHVPSISIWLVCFCPILSMVYPLVI
jgi:hypothetical protein